MVRYLFLNTNINGKASMNLKRIFGAILTLLGIIGLIYTGVTVIQHSANYTTAIVIGILALLFFFSGIALVKTTADQT